VIRTTTIASERCEMPEATDERRVDLVFQGGGVKGISLVGAYAVLEERGYQPQNLAGSSAGAIVAALVAAGYTARELHEIIGSVDFRSFLDPGWEHRIPAVGIPLSILKNQGIYKGKVFQDWMGDLLAAKGKRRFRDLVMTEFAEEPRYRYKLQVIASDVTDRRLLVLPQDAPRIGIGDADDLEIALAVRMSMSIPIFFEPMRLETAEGERLIVDGGMLSNFPVWLFDANGIPDWPTFGLKLVDPEPREPVAGAQPPPVVKGPLRKTVAYLTGLVSTMTNAHDKLYLEKADFARTITISNLGVGTTEFDLPRERAEELFNEGRRSAERFLDDWDFAAYIELFRTGKSYSRRQAQASELKDALTKRDA
jgi:NTE family protein